MTVQENEDKKLDTLDMMEQAVGDKVKQPETEEPLLDLNQLESSAHVVKKTTELVDQFNVTEKTVPKMTTIDMLEEEIKQQEENTDDWTTK